MQMEWNFDIFSPGSSVATDGEGGSQERVDTLGKSKFSTIPHICFWPEKMDQKSPPQFFGVKKIPPRSQLGLLLHQITMVRIQHKTWPSGSVIVNPPTTKLLSAFFTQFSLSLLPLSRKCIWARRADGERGENGANILGSSAPANVWRATLCPNVCECAQMCF